MTETTQTYSPESINHKNRLGKRTRKILGRAAAVVGVGLATAGVGVAAEHGAFSTERVTPEQAQQFQDALQPTTVKVARETIAKVSALEKSHTSTEKIVGSTFPNSDPDHPNGIVVSYTTYTPEYDYQITVETVKDAKGNPDPSKVYELRIDQDSNREGFASFHEKVFAKGNGEFDKLNYWSGWSSATGSADDELNSSRTSVVYDERDVATDLKAAGEIAEFVDKQAHSILAQK